MTPLASPRVGEPEWPFRVELRAAGWHMVSGNALSASLAESGGEEVPKDARFFRKVVYGRRAAPSSPGVLDEDGMDARRNRRFRHRRDAEKKHGDRERHVHVGLERSGSPGLVAARHEGRVDTVPRWVLPRALSNRNYLFALLSAPAVDSALFDETLHDLEQLK